MATTTVTTGVILFAHGARDPRWAEPFRRVADRVRRDAPALPLELAFLEFIAPDVPEAARRLAAQGVRHIHLVPLFFGPGGHLSRELPQLARAAMTSLPGVTVEVAPAAGEDDGVIDALAAYALQRAGVGGT